MNTNSTLPTRKMIFSLMSLLLLIGIGPMPVHAQRLKHLPYIGIEGGFGARTFTVVSDIATLNGMYAIHQGGNVSVVLGSESVRTRIMVLGAYSSAGQTRHDQQLYETSIISNLYPFMLSNTLKESRLQPYMAGGIALTRSKFYGTYLDTDAPYRGSETILGKVSAMNLRGGAGIEFQLKKDVDFINLFAEVMAGAPLTNAASNTVFANTKLKDFMAFNVGISFGSHRGSR